MRIMCTILICTNWESVVAMVSKSHHYELTVQMNYAHLLPRVVKNLNLYTWHMYTLNREIERQIVTKKLLYSSSCAHDMHAYTQSHTWSNESVV